MPSVEIRTPRWRHTYGQVAAPRTAPPPRPPRVASAPPRHPVSDLFVTIPCEPPGPLHHLALSHGTRSSISIIATSIDRGKAQDLSPTSLCRVPHCREIPWAGLVRADRDQRLGSSTLYFTRPVTSDQGGLLIVDRILFSAVISSTTLTVSFGDAVAAASGLVYLGPYSSMKTVITMKKMSRIDTQSIIGEARCWGSLFPHDASAGHRLDSPPPRAR